MIHETTKWDEPNNEYCWTSYKSVERIQHWFKGGGGGDHKWADIFFIFFFGNTWFDMFLYFFLKYLIWYKFNIKWEIFNISFVSQT